MRFEILSQLGAGAFGVVYKARDRETGEVVALKQLKPEIAMQQDLVERFKQELLLTRKVTHRNVCRVYDLYRENEGVFISMEYVEGERLRDKLNREGRFPLDEAFGISNQLFDGLEEAHSRDVVHRDLKPENIMIAVDGTVKLMDFGLARSLEPDVTAMATSGLSGTPAYMSPEQALGQVADARSDIYTLGLILYEMFSGSRAFTGDSAVSIAMKHVNEAPVSPLRVAPDLPEFVGAAILKCLSKDRAARFASIGELRLALTAMPASAGAAAVVRSSGWRKWAVAACIAPVAIAFAMLALKAGLLESTPSAAPPQTAALATPAAVAAPTPQQAQPPASNLPSMAVLDFNYPENDPQYTGFRSGIAEAFTGSFVNSKRFRIVERSQLDKAMKELELNRTDAVDPATAQRVGRLIGAQYLVLGSYQVFQGEIVINARLVKVETGEIIYTDKVKGRTAAALTLPDRLAASFLSQIR